MRKRLRPAQRKCVSAIYKGMSQNKAVYAECCVGFGKSLVLAHICNDVEKKGKRVIQIVPSRELCIQNYEEAVLYVDRPHNIGIASASLNKKEVNKKITIGTYKTLFNLRERLGHVDCVLIDETDLVSPKEDSVIRQFVQFLKDRNPKIKIAGLTGSIYRLDQGTLHDDVDKEDHSALFDECVFNYSIKHGIDDDILAIPKYIKTGTRVDINSVPLAGHDYNNKIMGVKFHAIAEAAVMDMIAIFVDNNITTSIIYAPDLECAEHIRQAYINECDKYSRHISVDDVRILSAKSSKEDRNDALNWLKNGDGRRYIINVGILIRGFNYKLLESVVFMVATKSLSKYIQCCGRVLRKEGDKAVGHIIDYGTNIARLGPCEEPIIERKRRGDGIAPMMQCDACNEFIPVQVKKCPFCGAEIEHKENDEGNYGFGDDIDPVIDIDVHHIDVSTRVSLNSGINMLVIDFYKDEWEASGTQYVCLNHTGLPKTLADQFVRKWLKNEKDFFKLRGLTTVENFKYLYDVNAKEFFKDITKVILTKKKGERFWAIKKVVFE